VVQVAAGSAISARYSATGRLFFLPAVRAKESPEQKCESLKEFVCRQRLVNQILNYMVKHEPAAALDSVFAALSDPTRRHILDLLARAELCVTELAKSFSVSLPAVSKHLRVLEKAGLITRERDGRVHHLRLQAKANA
jgi:DNA-binding transcriptional ArsR family regulator